MGIHPKVESYADIFNLPLLDLVAIMAKESGEMIDSVLIDEDDHWIKELGDICGLIIPPLLERAGLTYEEAAEIGRERFETKLVAHLRGEKAPTHKDVISAGDVMARIKELANKEKVIALKLEEINDLKRTAAIKEAEIYKLRETVVFKEEELLRREEDLMHREKILEAERRKERGGGLK